MYVCMYSELTWASARQMSSKWDNLRLKYKNITIFQNSGCPPICYYFIVLHSITTFYITNIVLHFPVDCFFFSFGYNLNFHVSTF